MKNEERIKQEAIEKAYGEYWDKVKDYIDENGFVESEHFPHGKIDADFGVYYGELASDFYIRPKSLKGIENNNGWIKIKSEDDLKLPDGDYGFILPNQKEVLIGKVRKGETTLNGVITYQGITHYYPIIKPKPPIY